MTKVNKQALGWALVVFLIIWGILMGTDSNQSEPIDGPVTPDVVVDDNTGEWPYPTEEEVRAVHPPMKKEVEVPETDLILNWTEDKVLIAPYPDYNSFSDAFAFARDVLGDSSEDGELKVFLWRGNKYNTETLKQSAAQDSVEEAVEPDTTVKDSTNN